METIYTTTAERVLSEYSDFLHSAAWYHDAHTGSARELAYLGIGLVEEAGEVSGVIKKALRVGPPCDTARSMTQERYVQLVYELGDVLWYHFSLLRVLRVGVEEVVLMNAIKLYERLLQPGEHQKRFPDGVQWPFSEITYEEAKRRVAHITGDNDE